MDNLLVRLVDVDDDSEILQIQFDEAERARDRPGVGRSRGYWASVSPRL